MVFAPPFVRRCALVLAALLFGAPLRAGAEGGLRAFSAEVEALSRKVAPSVVQVVATVTTHTYAPEASALGDFKERYAGVGSGTILGSEGYILTNCHVLEGARKVEVILHPEAVRAAGLASPLQEARVVGFSREFDLALLKVEAAGLPALAFRPEGLPRQGEVVFAFGSPQGLSDSVTLGVVSAVSRLLQGEGAVPFVQTDAPINPGSSGGPLVDVEGRVVGINTLLYSESGGNEGIGFAIPAYTARFAFGELREKGYVRRLGLGIAVRPLTPVLAAGLALPPQEGLLIEDVDGGEKEREGRFRTGELLLSLDGLPVRNLSDYLRAVQDPSAPPLRKVEVTDGKSRRTFAAPLVEGPLPEEVYEVSAKSVPLPELGVSVSAPGAGGGGASGGGKGVRVLRRFFPEAPEEEALLPGDILRAVGRTPVEDGEGLRRLVKARREGTPLVLQVEREGRLFYLLAEAE